MKKLFIMPLIALLAAGSLMVGCGSNGNAAGGNSESTTVAENTTQEISTAAGDETVKTDCPLEDGEYVAVFKTDSGMFHVNEANEDMGELTVKDGKMVIHVSLAGKGILNLYPGTKEEAQAEGAILLEPTEDTVTYSDGTTDDVYGFDIPVPYLDDEFDCALIGEKGKWYDHKVSVSVVE